jgi:cobalt-zinc-cadmium efflux system protein
LPENRSGSKFFNLHSKDYHSDAAHDPSKRLLLSVLLNAIITLFQIIGGILSNSLALISDAIHNLSDTMALVLAWVANKVGKRKPDLRRTFGYQRFEILSAFVNASVLTAVSIYLIYEAVLRFMSPEPVKSELMLVVAAAGLFVNLISALFLHRDSKHSLNVKAAYLHLLGDTLSSVAVMAGALLIRYTGMVWLDPLLTLIISIVIIRQAYTILLESVRILMQSTPVHLDLEAIKSAIEKNPRVGNVHHVHCWQLMDRSIFFEAHVEMSGDLMISESCVIRQEIEQMLKSVFHVTHVTIQVEYGSCSETGLISQPDFH